MKNFVDFVVDAAKDSDLVKELTKYLDDADHKAMSNWFKDKGYEVHEEECKKILNNKDDFKNQSLGIAAY